MLLPRIHAPSATLLGIFAALGASLSQPSPTLPPYLGTGGAPWGDADGSGSAPNTGATRTYNFDITRGNFSVNGISREGLLINGGYPGPLVEANWGDTVQVTVNNHIDNIPEGTSMHWHGQPQKNSPWMDGVPSVSQCPIAPGSSFTYSFQAEAYGTSWYHSHYSAQWLDGLYGPMIIYGPEHVQYDIDLGPVLLTDFLEQGYFEYIEKFYNKPPVNSPLVSNLINGKNGYNCTQLPPASNLSACDYYGGITEFQFTPGKTHRLRLINAGSSDNQKFTIDNHEMTVVAIDYVPVEPFTTDVITLGIGQRTDILVNGSGKASDKVFMRSDLDLNPHCNPAAVYENHALAVISYPNASSSSVPTTNATGWSDTNCLGDPLSKSVPYFPYSPPDSPAVTINYTVDGIVNATGFIEFGVNGESFHANYNNPLLLLANEGNTSYPEHPEWNVYNFQKNTSIRAIVYSYFPATHPMHLHGHNFWVLAEGTGIWDGKITNPQNPLRRDTHIVGAGDEVTPAYTVFEWETDNPGVWPFHCHIASHVSGGLYVNSMERPDLITEQQIPGIMAETCTAWNDWSSKNYVNEIDSGL